MSEQEYQVRYDGGALKFFPTLESALEWGEANGYDKISWTVGEGRIILDSGCLGCDGQWEYRTAKSLRKELEDEPT